MTTSDAVHPNKLVYCTVKTVKRRSCRICRSHSHHHRRRRCNKYSSSIMSKNMYNIIGRHHGDDVTDLMMHSLRIQHVT